MEKMIDLKFKYDLAVLVLGLNLIRGKWSIQILWYLNKGNLRFSELYGYFRYTSRSVFTKELHDLESAGLIKRKVFGETPPVRVEYSLTDIGEKLINSLESMVEWSKEYVKIQKEGEMSDIDFIQQSFLLDKYRAYKRVTILPDKKSS